MKYILCTLIVLGNCTALIAQKKPLDYAALATWPQINKEKISNDGKYILYTISSKQEGATLVIQSTDNSWKQEIKGATNAVFTEDSKRAVFKGRDTSLDIVELGKPGIKALDKIVSFQNPKGGNGQWLACKLKDAANGMLLLDLFTGKEQKYLNVENYTFSENAAILIWQQKNGNNTYVLHGLDLTSGNDQIICHGPRAEDWAMDHSGSQIAFFEENITNGQKNKEVWYYKTGMDSAKMLVNGSTAGMHGMTLGRTGMFFSPDGNNLFFGIHPEVKKNAESLTDKQSNLIIWSYKDDILNKEPESYSKDFQAVINLKLPKMVIRLETGQGDESISRFNWGYYNNQVIIQSNSIMNFREYKWRKTARSELYLVSTVNGSRELLKNSLLAYIYGFSPSGKYVYWFSPNKGKWMSYNLTSGITKSIADKIPFPVADNTSTERAGSLPPYGIAGWLTNDKTLLIYDQFDIWQVDPDGINSPVNVTNGYGRRHHTVLRCLDLNSNDYYHRTTVFAPSDTLTLYALNSLSKNNGFAKLTLNKPGQLTNLSVNPEQYYGVYGGIPTAEPTGLFGLKAKDAKSYIFKPTRDTLYPNIAFTKDLVHYQPLTHLEPQNKYNWYTTKLIHWKQANGKTADGILYKPENFDPKKKYPLIVYIYEQFSDALNAFLKPALANGPMEALWYVSHGYLVLVPDIHYKIGHTGESAFNSVTSAVHYLSGMPWVDAKHLGLQGHSFGGYEANYIVTRTNLFAAVCSADGVSDLISNSGEKADDGSGSQSYYEIGQGRMGTTLWEHPDLYIHESPIFKADNVTTPLLILHGTLDSSVPFSQGVEWFTALRRLGKKAWMLQYTDEDHTLDNEKDQMDYSVRLSQFFDHYLKGAPAPQWMTEGANNHSLQLDTSGKQP